MIKVFGHYSPDTDSVCSAIVWAWYLTEHTTDKATPYSLGPINSETAFVLEHFQVPLPDTLTDLSAGERVAIVDTNNPQELPATINETTLTYLIDHHKLVGGLSTESPTEITIRPLACTATVIFDLMDLSLEKLPSHIRSLLLCAILSDTLAFRSPTTTEHDIQVAKELATSLELSIDDLVDKLFTAKSNVSHFSDSELLTLDSKKYVVGNKNLRVSVLETTKPEVVVARIDGLTTAMSELIAEEADVDEVLLFIVDIINEEATVVTYNELTKQIVEASFNVPSNNVTTVLPGIVSRKKQILPALKL